MRSRFSPLRRTGFRSLVEYLFKKAQLQMWRKESLLVFYVFYHHMCLCCFYSIQTSDQNFFKTTFEFAWKASNLILHVLNTMFCEHCQINYYLACCVNCMIQVLRSSRFAGKFSVYFPVGKLFSVAICVEGVVIQLKRSINVAFV